MLTGVPSSKTKKLNGRLMVGREPTPLVRVDNSLLFAFFLVVKRTANIANFKPDFQLTFFLLPGCPGPPAGRAQPRFTAVSIVVMKTNIIPGRMRNLNQYVTVIMLMKSPGNR